MAMIDRNFTFATNGTVSAADLHNLIDSATIYQDLITGQVPITSVGTNYELLIADGTNPNAAPNAVTVYDLFDDALSVGTYTGLNLTGALTYGTATGTRLVSANATITTGTITTGVIPSLTAGTTTSTAATITSGTITNLASTTGTIATLNSTTPTFLGAITASTNTINVGSGQIFKDASGNFGIGTASPAVKLHVDSGSVALGAVLNSTNAVGSQLRMDNSGTPFGYIGTPNGILGSGGATGLAIRSENILAFGSGGATERLRIDSSGNVGIGTTSPINNPGYGGITLNGTSGALLSMTTNGTESTRIASIGDDTSIQSKATTGIITFVQGVSGGTERLRITSGGYLKASNTGTYVSSAAAYHEIRNDSSGNEALVLSNSATTAPYGMQIRFTATPNDATSIFLNCNDGNGTTNRAIIRSNGGILNYQANDANLSDERLKKDIIASPNYLEKICSIPVVNFKYKDQTHDDYNLGVIAQQLEAVCPELVDADGFGETPVDGIPIKTIYQTDLQYALMKCIQELKSENDSLKSRIEVLEAA